MAQHAQPTELVVVEVACRKAMCPVPRRQLLHTGVERTFEPEIGQELSEPGEIDAIVARIFAYLAGVGGAPQLLDDGGDVGHLIILCVTPILTR